MKILDGSALALEIIGGKRKHLSNILQHHDPKLAIILVGNNPASESYVNKKMELCKSCNITPMLFRFDEQTTTEDVIAKVQELNKDTQTFGILVQLPLPINIDKYEILMAIDPLKDVDCLHPKNLGYLSQGREYVKPCAVEAVMQVLSFNNIETLGKRIVILNRSALIGQPLTHILSQNGNATVTVCHEHTRGLRDICKTADILITAVGKRDEFFVDDSFIKPDAVVIDIGFSKKEKKILGDVDRLSTTLPSLLTPVPNGVGPITVACLILNFIKVVTYQLKKMRTARSISNTKTRYHTRKKNGLCRCGKILDREGVLCVQCHSKFKKRKLELKKEKKNRGECVNCQCATLSLISYCKQCYLKILAKSHLGGCDKWQELDNLFKVQNVCPYTGIQLILGENASLDRIIAKVNGGENVIENLQWVYKPVNFMKWDLEETEFLNIITQIYNYRIKGPQCTI